MVDIFIIHSGSDKDYVLDTVVPAILNNKQGEENGGCHANILLLGDEDSIQKGDYELAKRNVDYPENIIVRPSNTNNWKKIAKECIKRANAVLVIASQELIDRESAKEKTMGFEVRLAAKYNKLILLHKKEEMTGMPGFLRKKDEFTGMEKPLSRALSLEKIRERIDNYDMGYYNIFTSEKNVNGEFDSTDKKDILEQYKMYQKTSEDLVSRRQSVSSFYITVNSALIAVSGVMLGLVEFPNNLVVVFMMAIIGIILDSSWIRILEAYGMLNSAKMKVIRMMERELPVSLYDAEWEVMSDKLNQKRYVSFTDSEKRIPKLFMFVYLLIILSTVALFVLKY